MFGAGGAAVGAAVGACVVAGDAISAAPVETGGGVASAPITCAVAETGACATTAALVALAGAATGAGSVCLDGEDWVSDAPFESDLLGEIALGESETSDAEVTP